MSILDVSRTAASRELSARSHLTPSARVRPATSCYASGMVVEAMLDMAYPVLATNQARRTMPRHSVVLDEHLTRTAASRELSARSHLRSGAFSYVYCVLRFTV